jgi:hypothetical protein
VFVQPPLSPAVPFSIHPFGSLAHVMWLRIVLSLCMYVCTYVLLPTCESVMMRWVVVSGSCSSRFPPFSRGLDCLGNPPKVSQALICLIIHLPAPPHTHYVYMHTYTQTIYTHHIQVHTLHTQTHPSSAALVFCLQSVQVKYPCFFSF